MEFKFPKSQTMSARPVDRPRLEHRFRKGMYRPLTLVQAPLGYGKTTLIQAWMKLLGELGNRVAYLSLEGAEENSSRLLALTIARLSSPVGEVATEPSAALREDAADLATLLETIDRLRTRTFLVLDDFHEADEACQRIVGALLRHGADRWGGCRPPSTASQCAMIVVFSTTEQKGRQP